MSVRVGTTDRAITAFGGAELLRAAGRALGCAGELDDCLRLKKRTPGLSDTKFVIGVALIPLVTTVNIGVPSSPASHRQRIVVIVGVVLSQLRSTAPAGRTP